MHVRNIQASACCDESHRKCRRYWWLYSFVTCFVQCVLFTGYTQLQDDDKQYIRDKIAELEQHRENKTKKNTSPAKQTTLDKTLATRKRKTDDAATVRNALSNLCQWGNIKVMTPKKALSVNDTTDFVTSTEAPVQQRSRRSDSWRDFGRLCKRISDVAAHKEKTATVEKYIHGWLTSI